MLFTKIEQVDAYLKGRNLKTHQKKTRKTNFDVLEHIYVSDVATVLRDIFSHAKKLVILNVACYEANALLPNGENAHITVRNPHWWKGALDLISVEYPSVAIDLICSPQYNQMQAFPTFSDSQRQSDDRFFYRLLAQNLTNLHQF